MNRATPQSLEHIARIDRIPAENARARPDATALIQGNIRLTFAEWEAAIANAADALASMGLRPGDRFVIIAENGIAVAVLALAAARADAWPVILNARLSEREIASITDHAQPRFIAFGTDISPEAERHAGMFETQLVTLDAIPPFRLTIPLPCDPEPVHGNPKRDVAAMIYTSGTTGKPKGVMLSHANLMHVARNSGYLRGLAPDERVYGCLPVSHVFGLASVFLGSALYGATNYLVPRFDPSEAMRLLREEKLTVFQGVPAMFARLLEFARQAGRPIEAPALRYVSAGGAPLDLSLKARTQEALGVTLHNGYGMTELSPTVSQTLMHAPREDDSVGPILPGLAVRITDKSGAELPRGEVGVLHVKGPTVMLGYYRDPEGTAKVVTPDGWFDTGDLARLDPDGALFIVGRAKDLIIRSGFNVYPEEVEAVLASHPDVTLCAVIGRKVEANEEVWAFVQLRPGADFDEAAMRSFCLDRLAPYKRPSRIVPMDALPASSTGKILKVRLHDSPVFAKAGQTAG
jgi:long-chain acyl-CoA synthetase